MQSIRETDYIVKRAFFVWASKGSNLGPRSYQERALPLSHSPGNVNNLP